MTYDAAERREVEVVHVGVGEEHGVDGGKVGDAEAWFAAALEDVEVVSEDRVDEDGEAGDL